MVKHTTIPNEILCEFKNDRFGKISSLEFDIVLNPAAKTEIFTKKVE